MQLGWVGGRGVWWGVAEGPVGVKLFLRKVLPGLCQGLLEVRGKEQGLQACHFCLTGDYCKALHIETCGAQFVVECKMCMIFFFTQSWDLEEMLYPDTLSFSLGPKGSLDPATQHPIQAGGSGLLWPEGSWGAERACSWAGT